MMTKATKKFRSTSYYQQQGLCIYCEKPMWLDDIKAFAKQQSITTGQAKQSKCTAEHLIPKSEGGKNEQRNIAAACLFCNQTRHKSKHPLDPIKYKKRVMSRVAKDRWNNQIRVTVIPLSPQKHKPQEAHH